MDVYMGFVQAVAWNNPTRSTPQGWALCNGAQIAVANNQALYSLIGNTYGGNSQTFNLPDLRSRVIVGAGQGNGLSPYDIGQSGGTETVILGQQNLPPHNHPVTVTNPNLPVTGSINASMYVNSSSAGSGDPSGNYLGQLSSSSGDTIYASSQNASLNANAITVNSSLASNLNGAGINTGIVGGASPVGIIQPYLAMTYIIATSGTYPSGS